MDLKQLIDDRSGRASYLIAAPDGQAAIVDPGDDLVRYAALLRDGALRLRYVVETRLPGPAPQAGLLAANHSAELWAHPAGSGAPSRALRDGQELALGEVRLRVVTAGEPGREEVALLAYEPGWDVDPVLVLGADLGSAGRALRERVLRLPALRPSPVGRPIWPASGRRSPAADTPRRAEPAAAAQRHVTALHVHYEGVLP